MEVFAFSNILEVTASAKQQSVEVYLRYSAEVGACGVFSCMHMHATPSRTAKMEMSFVYLSWGSVRW